MVSPGKKVLLYSADLQKYQHNSEQRLKLSPTYVEVATGKKLTSLIKSTVCVADSFHGTSLFIYDIVSLLTVF